MRKAILLFVICLIAMGAGRKSIPSNLLHALNQVEARGRHVNVPPGDGGTAIGPFQIHIEYWQDAIDFDDSIGGSYADCNDYDYAVKIVTAYMERYGENFISSGNLEALARIHNGGPQGYRHSATKKYWVKVKSNL